MNIQHKPSFQVTTGAIPGSRKIYVAGEPHGLRNVGNADARYLVFEFDGVGIARPPRPPVPAVDARDVPTPRRPARWKRLLGKLLARKASEG